MNKIVVFGSFDPLHKGHEDLFRQAKEIGDYLVVVVASNENIRANKKHDPRMSEAERLESVRQNEFVDEAIIGDRGESYSILDKIKPDIIVIGYDQVVPEPLKNKIKQYKIVSLRPYKPEVYKSSLVYKVRKDKSL